MPRFTLAELALRVAGRVAGDAAVVVEGLKPLEEAGPCDLALLALPAYRKAAGDCAAGALLTTEDLAPRGRNALVVADPYRALAELVGLFHPPEEPPPEGVSDRAWVAPTARIGTGCSVAPMAVVGPRCVLGERVRLHSGVVLAEECEIGDDSVLHPGVAVYAGTRIGRRVIVHSGAVLGSDGFGYVVVEGRHRKIPQVGRLVVADDVEIGANVAVDRGSLGDTVIGRGTKIDNLVQVAHNVRIGEDSVLAGQSGVAGSSRLGRGVTLAGQSGVAGHLSLGDEVVVASKSAVYCDLPARAFVAGVPAVDHRAWKRAVVSLSRLDALRSEVRSLRRRLEELERLAGVRKET